MKTEEQIKSFYTFDCGCEFPILDPALKEDGLPSLDLDFDKINLNCKKAWCIFIEGKTKGVFQVEKSLGQHWSKLVSPTSVLEISDLISLMRPGTLGSKDESGKSMATHYVDRKNGTEEAIPLDPVLFDILKDTQQVILYQESILEIAKVVAGFDLKEADTLRKAVGKKDAELLAKVRINFIEKAKERGVVTEEMANIIFDNIWASARYSFNKSHGVAYGLITYYTAYIKAHFPLHFYTAWLASSREKADFKEEAAELINDARGNNVEIKGPSALLANDNFIIKNNKVCYGLGTIKGIGSSVKQITKVLKEYDLKNMSWLEILLKIAPRLNKTGFTALIKAGAFSYLGIYRQRMLAEYSVIEELTGKHEIPWLVENISNFKTLNEGIRLLLQTKNVAKTRKEKVLSLVLMLENPAAELVDSEDWVASTETSLFGTSLSCSKLDTCEKIGDTTCAEFASKQAKEYTLSVEIMRVSEYIPKSGKLQGKRMLYLTFTDNSGTIEGVAFPDCLAEYDYLLFKGNTVCIVGKKTEKGSISLTSVIQI